MKRLFSSCVPPALLLLLLAPPVWAAQACTWSEALLALDRGNQVRGMALMQMAARDGDARAVAWMREYQERKALAMTAAEDSAAVAARD